jgi:hypothetical protein
MVIGRAMKPTTASAGKRCDDLIGTVNAPAS